MKEEYISIAEFAERAGVSRQYIYKRLDGDLSPFVKDVNGKKRLKVAALRIFDVKQNDNADNNIDNHVDSEDTPEVSRELVAMLQEELRAKDRQIDNLTRLLDQEQKLHALTQKQLEAPADLPESKEPPLKAANERKTMTKDEERAECERLWAMMPKSPGLFASQKEVAEWEDAQDEALSKMAEWEKELIIKRGYKKGFRYLWS
jgi:hypothetical protein